MKSNSWLFSVLILGLVGIVPQGFAAEVSTTAQAAAQPAVPVAAAPAAEEEPEYAFGTAKSVNGNQLTINEFDYDTGEERETVYELDAATEYDNVAAASEIAPGDEVDIDFFVKDGKKTAVAVSVAKPLEGEEGA